MTQPAPKEVPDWIRSVIILDPEDIWGQITGMGLGQLAVRLGYPGGFDNRGDVLFTDSFEEGLSKGTPALGDGDAAVEVSSTSCRLGGLSLKLTTDAAGSRYAAYYYYLPYPALNKVGVQACFTVEANTEFIYFDLILYDGDIRYQGSVGYDHTNKKIVYLGSDNERHDLITGVDLYAQLKGYHYLKMVLDLETSKYHRVLVDGWSWTDGDLDLYTIDRDETKRFYFFIQHSGQALTNAVSYVDGVVITQNEPV